MKVPRKIQTEIERNARLIVKGDQSWEEGLDALEPLLGKEEYRLFLSEIIRRWCRNQMKAFIAGQIATAADDEENGQPQLPFPDLPAHLEIAPGTFKHQGAMAMKDWNAAVVQAETKALNATGFAERVRRARDRAGQLLAGDQTLVDVLTD